MSEIQTHDTKNLIVVYHTYSQLFRKILLADDIEALNHRYGFVLMLIFPIHKEICGFDSFLINQDNSTVLSCVCRWH